MHTQQQVIHSNQPINQPQQQPKAEQIYAPVAHLQQKMMHQQQGNLQQIQAQPAAFPPGSPESTEYGFGVQFQQHQSQFYQIQKQNPHSNSHQYANNHSEMLAQTSSATSSPHHVNLYHLQHQQHADTKGNIGTFHKNHPANLINVCEECHVYFPYEN
jgi:hypothetical protein